VIDRASPAGDDPAAAISCRHKEDDAVARDAYNLALAEVLHDLYGLGITWKEPHEVWRDACEYLAEVVVKHAGRIGAASDEALIEVLGACFIDSRDWPRDMARIRARMLPLEA
jgi:hypothetical protein